MRIPLHVARQFAGRYSAAVISLTLLCWRLHSSSLHLSFCDMFSEKC